jgi:hypothetical protein
MQKIENFTVRPVNTDCVTIAWTSDSAENWSWICVNGVFRTGPIRQPQTDRTATIVVSKFTTFKIEVFDATNEEMNTIANPSESERESSEQESQTSEPVGVSVRSNEEKPNVYPTVSWNEVAGAEKYVVAHGEAYSNVFSQIAKVPATLEKRNQMVMTSPLNGQNDDDIHAGSGQWHTFRVNTIGLPVSSANDVAMYISDLPPVRNLKITKNPETGLFDFTIYS